MPYDRAGFMLRTRYTTRGWGLEVGTPGRAFCCSSAPCPVKPTAMHGQHMHLLWPTASQSRTKNIPKAHPSSGKAASPLPSVSYIRGALKHVPCLLPLVGRSTSKLPGTRPPASLPWPTECARCPRHDIRHGQQEKRVQDPFISLSDFYLFLLAPSGLLHARPTYSFIPILISSHALLASFISCRCYR